MQKITPPEWVAVRPDAGPVLVETDEPVGTNWPYGCGWCGRSTKHDDVEVCDYVGRVVHAECHEGACTRCANILCTVERCDHRDECDGCGEEICRRHGQVYCLC